MLQSSWAQPRAFLPTPRPNLACNGCGGRSHKPPTTTLTRRRVRSAPIRPNKSRPHFHSARGAWEHCAMQEIRGPCRTRFGALGRVCVVGDILGQLAFCQWNLRPTFLDPKHVFPTAHAPCSARAPSECRISKKRSEDVYCERRGAA